MNIEQQINKLSELSDRDRIKELNKIREAIHDQYGLGQPVDLIQWVPVEKVCPNDYNPNSVANVEMGLLYTSIKHDGYTQPIVTIYDKEKDKYIIIDGFHRYYICKTNKDIFDRNKGHLPVVVLKKDINERMAATVRHNRARGEHSVTGMSNMVFEMLSNGWSDEKICNHLGMSAEEINKLKHITGFSKLFKDHEYNKSWATDKQLKQKWEYEKVSGGDIKRNTGK